VSLSVCVYICMYLNKHIYNRGVCVRAQLLVVLYICLYIEIYQDINMYLYIFMHPRDYMGRGGEEWHKRQRE